MVLYLYKKIFKFKVQMNSKEESCNEKKYKYFVKK